MAVDQAKLDAFVGRVVGDMGAAMSAALVVLGDKLGLYKAMGGAGPLTPAELAERTSTSERYVHEWLCAQAASGYVSYDAASGKFSLTEEQAFALADDQSPAHMLGAFHIILSMFKDEAKIAEAFRRGHGVGWHEHSDDLFHGTERFFRAGYQANLVSAWIPALDGVEAKLKRGIRVADVGCGHGASTVIMAQAFPRSTFVGFDYHQTSIDAARQRATQAGVTDRVRFEVATAKDFPGRYEFVTVFDALHDMGDPSGAAAHVYQALEPDGTWMIVEPFAGDRIEDNLNPVGRVFYSASTFICTPGSKAQEVGLGLGAQAGEARLREVVTAGGFTRFRRATSTPFNLVLEARP
ncbi:MAG TPA: class I SAM-dependent methyltransferase [Candidatus Kryptonia bacterium]|nr:class I SAM-dependent methyltransferase [Candidatus Kryptonia bacterium]